MCEMDAATPKGAVDLRTVVREYGLTQYALKELAVASALGRHGFEAVSVLAAALAGSRRNEFARANYVCRAMRLLEGWPQSTRLNAQYRQVLADVAVGTTENRVVQSYLRTSLAAQRRQIYLQHGAGYAAALKFPRDNDTVRRQGNLVVLKAHDPVTGEKGVLYLQYTESIPSFVALFDLARVAERYRLVVEPSSWGYQDEVFLLLVRQGFDVVIQAQDRIDYDYVAGLRSNLTPLRLGAGDWIDPHTFTPGVDACKEFDFVMVASWSPVKRHGVFFDALEKARLSAAAVALVGYPWEGRTRADMERLARRHHLSNVTIYERISREQVADVVRRSRVGVMLTRREGANRGVYECLFSDVPVIVSAENRGFNRDHVNTSTGMLASDRSLPAALIRMRDEYRSFQPRRWALANTGYRNAWQVLNRQLQQMAIAVDEPFGRDLALIKSAPAAIYDDDNDRDRLASEYVLLQKLMR